MTTNPPQCKYLKLSYPVPFVAHVEINRPEKLNAFIEPMWLELPILFSHLSTEPSTRAIVLSGAGPKAFTTGLDIQAASQGSILGSNHNPSPQNQQPHETSPPPPRPLDPARTASLLRQHITSFQRSITSLSLCPKPLIAALHGHCLGLGLDIALCADVRICTPATLFSVKEVDIGLAADIGTLSRLPKVVGNGSWVKDVCLSGRGFGAGEARGEGVVSWVGSGKGGGGGIGGERGVGDKGKEEVVREAVRWAEMVAGKSPVAVQGTKELLNWSWERRVEDGLRYTSVWNSAALQTEDVREAIGAGMEKRRPRFEKL